MSRANDPSLEISIHKAEALRIAPQHDLMFSRVDEWDPAVRDLAQSIREVGVLEPLVITADGHILSGHRRYQAALLAGLERLPCRVVPFELSEHPQRFVEQLCHFKRP